MPDSSGHFTRRVRWATAIILASVFSGTRTLSLELDNNRAAEQLYYFRIRSAQIADVIIVLRLRQ